MQKSFTAGLILLILFLCSCQNPDLRSTEKPVDLQTKKSEVTSNESDLEQSDLKQEDEELRRLSKTLGKMKAKTGKLQKGQQDFTDNLEATSKLPKRTKEIEKEKERARKSLDTQTEDIDQLLEKYSE